jgi:hypothetical protein
MIVCFLFVFVGFEVGGVAFYGVLERMWVGWGDFVEGRWGEVRMRAAGWELKVSQ